MRSDKRFKENIAEALKNNNSDKRDDRSGTVDDTEKTDVFLSYSSLNKNVADAVVSDFEQHGIRCWYAPRDIMPGQEWVTAIHEAINACRLFILIYTDSSNESKQVANEVALAFNAGKTLIPFKLSDTEMSSELEYYLTRVHWLDAVDPPLLKSIETLREYSEKILKGIVPKDYNVRNAGSALDTNAGSAGGRKGVNATLIAFFAALAVICIAAIILLFGGNRNPEKGSEQAINNATESAPESSMLTESTADKESVPSASTAGETSDKGDTSDTEETLNTDDTSDTEETLNTDTPSPDEIYKTAYEYQAAAQNGDDYDKAYDLYMQTGDVATYDEKIIDAIYELASYYYNDMDDEEKKNRALDLYDKAASCGSIKANNFLGGYYLDIDHDPDEVKYAAGAYKGNGMTDALAKAIDHYETSAEKNDAIALYSLGYIYENPDGNNNITHLSDDTPYDYEKALEYYEKAANAGHRSAQAAYDRVKSLIGKSGDDLQAA